jgi:hypothetical protein
MPSSDFADELLAERPLHRRHAEDAAVARAGHGHAHALAVLHHKDSDQRITRSRIRKLHVSRLHWDGKTHMRDNLALFERGIEQAREEIVGGNFALVRDDRRAERETRRRIVGRRVVVRNRTADRAAIAHGRIADIARERAQRRDGFIDDGGTLDIGMARHGADHNIASLAFGAREPGHVSEVDQILRRCQTLLESRNQRLSACEQLGVLRLEESFRAREIVRPKIIEIVHCLPDLHAARRLPFMALAPAAIDLTIL